MCLQSNIFYIPSYFCVSLISLLFYFISFHFISFHVVAFLHAAINDMNSNSSWWKCGWFYWLFSVYKHSNTSTHRRYWNTIINNNNKPPTQYLCAHNVCGLMRVNTGPSRFKLLTQQLFILYAVNADNPSDSVSKLYNPSGVDVSYSTRHVEESWHHLMKSEDTAKFKQIAVCNFDFLLAAVSVINHCWLSLIHLFIFAITRWN